MPKRRENIDVPLSSEDCYKICREVAAKLNWAVEEENAARGRLVCVEANYADWVRGTWPVKLEILIEAKLSATNIVLNGANRGFGPIQSRHLETQMGNFKNQLWLIANEAPTTTSRATDPLASRLRELGKLYEQGVLTDEEFSLAKRKLLGS